MRAPWGTYRRLADAIRDRLTPGGPVPSEADLCTQYGVSRTTVRRALGVLAAEGRIRTVPGRGRVAAGGSPAEPAYVIIAADLRREVAELPPGAPVPSEAQVSRRWDVSRPTARRALAELGDVVRVVPGRGRVRR